MINLAVVPSGIPLLSICVLLVAEEWLLLHGGWLFS